MLRQRENSKQIRPCSAKSSSEKSTTPPSRAQLEYIGRIGIDSDLVEKADLWPGQRVLVVSNTTGERLETYIIPEPAGSGEITMPGGAARRIGRGKEIIILGFALSEAAVEAKCALVDAENRFVRYL